MDSEFLVTYLRDVMPLEKLREHVRNGVVRSQQHPYYPNLLILNYTEKAQFETIWDDVTTKTRGLIIDTHCHGPVPQDPFENATILARAFDKFHNLNSEFAPETMEENLPKDISHVTEKLDGSLGIIFRYDEKVHVATRGSFDSVQARWATQYLREILNPITGEEYFFWPKSITPVVEIIFKENRIVVEYDYEGLVLLGIIDSKTGKEEPRIRLERFGGLMGLPVVKKFNKSLIECATENGPNFEGYVVTFINGVKVKVKFEEYCRLHRVLTGLSPIAVWEMLKNGQSNEIEDLLTDLRIPEGFKKWLSKWSHKLTLEFIGINMASHTLHAQAIVEGLIKPEYTRPERATLARWVLKKTEEVPYQKGLQFALADGKDIKEDVWDLIRPNGKDADPFKRDGEF